ncbi:unnamed protein product [Ambrosiozyma monospora]|uniref:Unnamed protein product n=1 Tax=Ambrosiozyma monospora TaxID=43982 RepID=A0ACB5T9C0_AMBMO|nr:unnamed protein product [Ambrosiozyma monospora]
MLRLTVAPSLRKAAFAQLKRAIVSSSVSTIVTPSLSYNRLQQRQQHNQYQRSLTNQLSQVRFYSAVPELTKDIIKERIIELLESYNKVKPGTEITEKSSFTKDLGLDSFDTVEVVMELEYEFSIIIPDHEADEIKTVGQAIEFIAKQPDAC